MGNSAFSKALNNNASPAKAKSKAKKTVAYVSISDEVKEAIDSFQAAKKAEKQAKAEMAFHETVIIDAVKTIQDKDGFNNQYQKSYNMEGVDDGKNPPETAKYVSTNRASISQEDKDTIQKLLGSDYDFLMNENHSVSLKAEIFDDEAKQEELMKLLGEKFAEFFDVDMKLSIAEDYDKNIFAVTKTQSKLDKVRTYVKMYKAAIR